MFKRRGKERAQFPDELRQHIEAVLAFTTDVCFPVGVRAVILHDHSLTA